MLENRKQSESRGKFVKANREVDNAEAESDFVYDSPTNRCSKFAQFHVGARMKLYKCLSLVVLLGIPALAVHASVTAVGDPDTLLRGTQVDATTVISSFAGTLTSASDNENFTNGTMYPFVALDLFFPSGMTYSCDNSQDPFFTTCTVTGDEVEFYGLDAPDGIPPGANYNIEVTGLPSGSFDFTGAAFGPTPEPASALLFLSGFGAMVGFLKRRSNSIAR
jgi:hypothetical protein